MSNQQFVTRDGILVEYKGAGGDVVIPEGIKEIWWAFQGCTSLTGVVLPKGVKIEWGAFKDCVNLNTVTIPEGVQIGEWAFKNTPWLKGLGEFAVVNQILLSYQGNGGDVTLPEGIKTIGKGAFRDCDSLQAVTIPEWVEKIDEYAFDHCTGLTAVTMPKGIEIGRDAFYHCTSLQTVTIPKEATVGYYAFEYCESLTSVRIPEHITKIDETWFRDCPISMLIAPHIPIGDFTPADKPSACCGFAVAWLEGQPMEQTRAGYLNYIKRQKKRLYPAAFQHQQLLRLMMMEKMIPRQDIDLLLEECDKQKNLAAKAALLEYAGKNLKPVDPMREFRL